MTTVNTGVIAKALWPGLNNLFGQSYNEHDMECMALFDTQSSDKNYEETVLFAGLGLAPAKGEGASITYDAEKQGYTARFINVTYALGMQITEEAVEDDQYRTLGERRTRLLGRSMRQTKENVAANVYNNGFSNTGPDGVAMLSASHPTQAGNQSNLLTVAADLSEASLEDLCIQIGNALDDRGLRIALNARSLHIPNELEFIASRILNSVQQSGTANNDINALREMSKFPGGVYVNHYFSDSDAFFIRTDMPEGQGMLHFNRVPVSFAEDNDFDTGNIRFKARERYSFGYDDWRGVFGTPGA